MTDQKSPLKERWGRWYVSNARGGATMANAAVAVETSPVDGRATAASLDLEPLAAQFYASAYLEPGSDQVALLVLGHQTQMHNLITLVNYQTRIALHAVSQTEGGAVALESLLEKQQQLIKTPVEQLLRHLLFAKEAPLGIANAQEAVASSSFAKEFVALGQRDAKKRSLRDFDLNDRVFRYPCSNLIHSTHFDALPEPAKGYVYHRLLQILSGEDQDADFAHLTAHDRQAILSILLETKPGLPTEWHAYASAHHIPLGKPLLAAGRSK